MQWSTRKAYFWEEAPFFRFLLPFIAGIACYDAGWLNIGGGLILGVSLLLLSIVVTLHIVQRTPALLSSACLHLFLFLAACNVCYLHDIRNDHLWFGHRLSADAFVCTIRQVPEEKEHTWKLSVSVDQMIRNGQLHRTTGNALIYVYKNKNLLGLMQGSRILVPDKWQEIKNAGNPFEFDYKQFAARQHIYYQQFLPMEEIVQAGIPETSQVPFIARSHNKGMEILAQYVKDRHALGLLQAMLLGDEVNFDDEQRQLYAGTGVIHVVAISGGHVAFLFLLIAGCFFWIRDRKYYWIKYLVALPVVWLYVMIAGAPSSAIRSVVMFSILGIGFIAGRNSNTLNQLFATAFLILLIKPLWIFSVGFQLSFVAVLSLILFYKPVYRLWIPASAVLRKLWNIAALSIAAELLVAPLVIFYFHSFPAGFIPANILAWLMMGLVMCGAMMIICLSNLPLLATSITGAVTILVKMFNSALHYLQLLNPISFSFLCLSTAELILTYIMIGGTAHFLINKHKNGLFISMAACSLLLASICLREWKILHQHSLIIYNINRVNYADLISGKKYYSILANPSPANRQKIQFACGETRLNLGTREQKYMKREMVQIGSKTILILDQPLQEDSSTFQGINYLLINYPLNEFNAPMLQNIFRFQRLIIAGDQKRYIVRRWKDSCDKYHIPVHATLLDGAFILRE